MPSTFVDSAYIFSTLNDKYTVTFTNKNIFIVRMTDNKENLSKKITIVIRKNLWLKTT